MSWKLSQGPLDIGFIIPHLERGLTYPDKGIQLKLGRASLEWSSLDMPLQIRVDDLVIETINSQPIAIISKISLSLSAKSLVAGRLVPKTVTIFEPALKIYRTQDGSFSFDIGKDVHKDVYNANTTTDTEFIKKLLFGIGDEKDPHQLGGDLQQINIVNAWVGFQNVATKTTLIYPRADIILRRSDVGIDGQARLDLEIAENEIASLQTRLLYNRNTQKTRVMANFNDIDPIVLSEKDPALSPLNAVEFKIGGSISMILNSSFMPEEVLLTLNGKKGALNLPALYQTPLPIQKSSVEMVYTSQKDIIALKKLELDLGDAEAMIAGIIKRNADEKLDIALKAKAINVPINKLNQYWPQELAQDARKWVTENLSDGTAQTATLNFKAQAPAKDLSQVKIENLGGDIDFTDITVNYLTPMPKIKNVSGTANYGVNHFKLDLAGGLLEGMTIPECKILIDNFDKASAPYIQIDIDANVTGPVKNALRVINSDPLNYATQLGINPENTAGTSQINVNFQFPLKNSLQVEEVNVIVDAKLEDTLFENMVAGQPLAGGPLSLKIHKNEMKVTGPAKLSHTPLNLSWTKYFDKDADVQDDIEASLNIDTQTRKNFNIAFENWISGDHLPAQISFQNFKNKTQKLSLQADATHAILQQPELGYTKPSGQKASIEATAHLKEKQLESIKNLKIKSTDLHLEGLLNFSKNKSLSYASFPIFKVGKTDTTMEGELKPDGSFEFAFKGLTLDASSLLKKTPKPQDFKKPEPPQRGTPIAMSFDLQHLITGEDRGIHNVKSYIYRDEWGRIHQLEIDGQSGGSDVYARYLPDEKGFHSLRFEAGNAGAALRALNISTAIDGGVLIVDGKPHPNGGPRDLAGAVSLTNFKVIKMPLLARLLSAMSLQGIQQLLSGGKGISFRKLATDFSWEDTVWAAGQIGEQRLTLKNGRTSGSALGLTVEGKIDYVAAQYDLNGTIVPISGVNKLIGNIPLVGDILTGGTDAVFAATYTIKGPSDNPKVIVNPLAALAPGILRRILFEE